MATVSSALAAFARRDSAAAADLAGTMRANDAAPVFGFVRCAGFFSLALALAAELALRTRLVAAFPADLAVGCAAALRAAAFAAGLKLGTVFALEIRERAGPRAVLATLVLAARALLACAGLTAAFVLAAAACLAAVFAFGRAVFGRATVVRVTVARAFFGLGSLPRFAFLPRPAPDFAVSALACTALDLGDFAIFLTDDIRGALLFGSALETEHSGNGGMAPAVFKKPSTALARTVRLKPHTKIIHTRRHGRLPGTPIA